jgi:hypothetical protein
MRTVMTLQEIWRYPVKSLSGQSLDRVVLNPDLGLPHDRRWALARPDGNAVTDKDWHPKSQFVVLVREFALAALNCQFDERSGVFSLQGPDGLEASGNLASEAGRTLISNAVASHLGHPADQAPILVEAKKIGYFDTQEGPLSILNLASLRALEEVLGQPIDPLRFRMNFLIDGAEAWAERQWLGKRLRIGKTKLLITEGTGRCKATHVNPTNAVADVNVLSALKSNFGHTEMGIYAKVICGGLVQPGDKVEIIDA